MKKTQQGASPLEKDCDSHNICTKDLEDLWGLELLLEVFGCDSKI